MAVPQKSDLIAESILVWMVHSCQLDMEALMKPTYLNFCAMVHPSMASKA